MSVEPQTRRLTAVDIGSRKGGTPIVSLTSYHAHTASIMDPYVDFIVRRFHRARRRRRG